MEPRRSSRRRTLLLATVALLAIASVAQAQGRTTPAEQGCVDVELNHGDGTFGDRTVRVKDWQCIQFNIRQTDRSCFTFNVEEDYDSSASLRGAAARRRDVTIRTEFDPSIVAYLIEANRRQGDDVPKVCQALAEGTWMIHTKRIGWAVGFAGAFVGDDLTDREFYLKDGVQEMEGAEEGTEGYFVHRRLDAEDSYHLGTAAMVHIFKQNARTKLFREWAPLSFGLGVTKGSDLRYYLGTSWKFGEQAFLTAGKAFGSRTRLPRSLSLGDFTTDAEALANLPSRTEDGWFVAISYTFLSTGVESFLGKGVGVEKPKANPAAQ